MGAFFAVSAISPVQATETGSRTAIPSSIVSAGSSEGVYSTVSRTGSFLSQEAGIREGEPLAYLIAPPVEAMTAMDAALKAADVRLAKLYGPPSETNFGGGLLTGTQSACRAACDAFATAVEEIAARPK